MSSQGRRRSVIEAAYERAAKAEDEFISKLDEREKKPLDETLASLPASQVPAESGSLEAVIRHIVANGLVPFTFGVALQKGRVFEPKVIQGEIQAAELPRLVELLPLTPTRSAHCCLPQTCSSSATLP